MAHAHTSRVGVLVVASVAVAAAGLGVPSGAAAAPYLGYCNDSVLTFNTPYACTTPGTYDISLPTGSRSVAVDLQGGGGGGAPVAGSAGGNAAHVTGRNFLLPGGTTKLRVIVANGGYASRTSFKSGGGASAIIALDADGAVKAKLAIAGGGGGGAKDGAGGDAGQPGTSTNSKVSGGQPGAGPNGGLGGSAPPYGTYGATGQNDSPSLPTVALGGVGPYSGEQAGNGGAGYAGGGSGSLTTLGDTYVAGGGGGSSFVAADFRSVTSTIAPQTKGKAGRDGSSGFAILTLNQPWAPSAVVAPTYTPAYSSLQVLFHKPFSDGGVAISGYQISLDGGRSWQALRYTGPAGGPYRATVTGLTPGRTYQVRMQAFNSVGYGDAARSIAVTTRPLTAPSGPVGLQASPGAARGTLALLWHKPVEDGGSPILGYRVSLNGGATWQPPLTVRGPASGPYTATVTGLVSGRSYAVRIQSWNAQGFGGAPSPVTGVAR